MVTQVVSCDRCQRQNKLKKSVGTLHPIPVKSKLLYKMGMDLIDPLPETTRGNKYYIGISVTYFFSKWAEAAPLPSKHAVGISKFIYSVFFFFCYSVKYVNQLQLFFSSQVMCPFGCPHILITDQGREFINRLSSELYSITKTHHLITN